MELSVEKFMGEPYKRGGQAMAIWTHCSISALLKEGRADTCLLMGEGSNKKHTASVKESCPQPQMESESYVATSWYLPFGAWAH